MSEEEFEADEEYCGESKKTSVDKVDDENMDPEEAAFMEGYDAADEIDKEPEEPKEEEEQ